jgi:hypothetical protein
MDFAEIQTDSVDFRADVIRLGPLKSQRRRKVQSNRPKQSSRTSAAIPTAAQNTQAILKNILITQNANLRIPEELPWPGIFFIDPVGLSPQEAGVNIGSP